MTVPRPRALVTAALAALLVSSAAAAQPLGAFTWQMQPYCNRVTLQVVQSGSLFTLAGFDNQCGIGTGATVAGVASLNVDGTVSLGFSIITPEVAATHVYATVSLSTLGGPWRDASGREGTLAFNASDPGDPRPSPSTGAHQAGGYHGWGRFGGGYFFATASNGTDDAPEPIRTFDTLGRFGAGGFNGQFSHWPTGMLDMTAVEDWTPTSHGTRMRFLTTQIGTTNPTVKMLVDHNGFVGIGTGNERPDDLLHVRGDIRVGVGGTNGCLKNGNGGAIIGTCSSDSRFKRDVVAYENLLPRVAALQPVAFSWRSSAFPEQGFGPEREAGLVAQDVERVLPELVTTDADGFKAVDYSKLPLLAIQAIRELKEKNDALESRLAAIEALLGKR